MLAFYESSKSWSGKGFRVFAPEGLEGASVMVREISEVFERWKEEVAGLETNSSCFSILLTESQANFSDWENLRKPGRVVVLQLEEDLKRRVADVLIRSSGKTSTYSSLLLQGLTEFLARERIYSDAAAIIEDGSWTPLEGAFFRANRAGPVELEAAGFVKYVLERYGAEEFSKIWHMTTPLGGDNSLELALREVLGKGLSDVEAELIRLLEENDKSE